MLYISYTYIDTYIMDQLTYAQVFQLLHQVCVCVYVQPVYRILVCWSPIVSTFLDICLPYPETRIILNFHSKNTMESF